MMTGLTIGKLAKKAGVSIDTVRFYERMQLIQEPERSLSNYRIYPEDDIHRLRFIQKTKNLGFSLSEIKDLLELRCDHSSSKAEVKKQVEDKIDEIKLKINDLNRILSTLEQMSAECDGQGPISDCPILKALDEQEDIECHNHS